MSVCGTDTEISCSEDFLGGIGSTEFPRALALEFSTPSARNAGADLPTPAWPSGPNVPYPMARSAYLPASPLCFVTKYQWCRNFDLLSIAFACALRLRTDLPYADQRCVGNLRLSAFWILTRINATHAGILTSQRSTEVHTSTSTPWQRSPTIRLRGSAASVVNFSPVTFSAQDPSTSELLRTL